MSKAEFQKKGEGLMVSDNHRIFRITADVIHQQIAALQDQYTVLGMEAAAFDKDGDANHDVVVYQNQAAQENLSGQIENLRKYLNNDGFIYPESLNGLDTITVGHEVDLQIRYPDSEEETLSVLLGSEIDGLVLGKRNDLGVRILSVVSALGSSLKGKKIGDQFEADAPGGKLKLKINNFKISPLLDRSIEVDP